MTYSGDILTDVDSQALINEHFRRGNDVTLALRETGLGFGRGSARSPRRRDIANRYGTNGKLDFANIAVWNPTIFAANSAATEKFHSFRL